MKCGDDAWKFESRTDEQQDVQCRNVSRFHHNDGHCPRDVLCCRRWGLILSMHANWNEGDVMCSVQACVDGGTAGDDYGTVKVNSSV
jgi:glucose dehydrogenase